MKIFKAFTWGFIALGGSIWLAYLAHRQLQDATIRDVFVINPSDAMEP